MLMYVVLTGGVPPFAHSLAQAGCRGMCADALQRLVSAALARGLAASALSEPLPRAAQVRHPFLSFLHSLHCPYACSCMAPIIWRLMMGAGAEVSPAPA